MGWGNLLIRGSASHRNHGAGVGLLVDRDSSKSANGEGGDTPG